MRIRIAIEKFLRGGGTFHIDDKGTLSLSFIKPGDPILEKFHKLYPPGTPKEKMVLERWAIDIGAEVKSYEMEELAAFLEKHSDEVKAVYAERYGTVFVSERRNAADFDYTSQALDYNLLRLDFMRRDPEFSAGFNKARELRHHAGYTEPTINYLKTVEGEIEADLCAHFDLTPPFPSPDFDKNIVEWIEHWWSQGTRLTVMGRPSDLITSKPPFFFSYPEGKPHEVTIKIDLTRAYSLPSLMEKLSRIIQQHAKENGLQIPRPQKMTHSIQQLQTILAAGHAYYHAMDATYDTVMDVLLQKHPAGLKDLHVEAEASAYNSNREKIKHMLSDYRSLTENHEWRKIGAE